MMDFFYWHGSVFCFLRLDLDIKNPNADGCILPICVGNILVSTGIIKYQFGMISWPAVRFCGFPA